jgi:hypothetical protein
VRATPSRRPSALEVGGRLASVAGEASMLVDLGNPALSRTVIGILREA